MEKLQRLVREADAARATAFGRVAELSDQVASLESRLRSLDVEQQRQVGLLQEAKARLRRRAVATYVATPVAPLNQAAKAKSFGELTRRLAMVSAVVRADQTAISRYEAGKQKAGGDMERLVTDLHGARAASATAAAVLQDADSKLEGSRVQLQAATSPLGTGELAFPVDGPHSFTDTFGAPRMTGTAYAHAHQGTDIFTPPGTPLVAVERGVLLRVGVGVLGGNKLWLAGASGTRYFYAHLSAFAEGVADGKLVEARQVVGYAGNTGNAKNTPPYLHFEIHPGGGVAINPFPLLVDIDSGRHTMAPPSAPSIVAPYPGAPPAPNALPPPVVPPLLARPLADEAGRRQAEQELEAAEARLEAGKADEAKAAGRAGAKQANLSAAEAIAARRSVEEQAVARQLGEARARMARLGVSHYMNGGHVGPALRYLLTAGTASDLARRASMVESLGSSRRLASAAYEGARRAVSEQVESEVEALEAAKHESARATAELGSAREVVAQLRAEVEHRRLLLDVAQAAAPLLPTDIPRLFVSAYQRAEAGIAREDPACSLRWPVLAAIGKVESDHGRSNTAQLALNGDLFPPIVGVRLDGTSTALVSDTDGGRLDGDQAYDRAVGPMQFIPSSWRRVASDGNGDGMANVQNAHDAALAAATYLCSAAGGRLRPEDPEALRQALFSYNHSNTYVETVLSWVRTYEALAHQLSPLLIPLSLP